MKQLYSLNDIQTCTGKAIYIFKNPSYPLRTNNVDSLMLKLEIPQNVTVSALCK